MTYLVEAEMVEVVEACAEEPPSGLAGAAVGVVQQTSPTAGVALGAEGAVLQAFAGAVPKSAVGLVEQLFAGQELM